MDKYKNNNKNRRSVITNCNYVPNCTSDINTDTGIWKFQFRNNVILSLNTGTHEAVLEVEKKDVKYFYKDIETVGQLNMLQRRAEKLAGFKFIQIPLPLL